MSHAGRTTDLAAVAARLGHLLHAAGIGATPERSGRFAAALALARPVTLEELYWLGRITLLTGSDQIPLWDRVFAQVFGGLVDEAEFRGQAGASQLEAIPHELQPAAGRTPPDRTIDDEGAAAPPMAGTGPSSGGDAERETVLVAISATERLRTQDFATLTPDELLRLRALMQDLVAQHAAPAQPPPGPKSPGVAGGPAGIPAPGPAHRRGPGPPATASPPEPSPPLGVAVRHLGLHGVVLPGVPATVALCRRRNER